MIYVLAVDATICLNLIGNLPWRRHLMARVVLGPPWLEKKKIIYNNLKFYIYLPLKIFLGPI